MVAQSSLLICPICGSMDIQIIDITIDGVTEQYYHCEDCEFEWPVDSSLSAKNEVTGG